MSTTYFTSDLHFGHRLVAGIRGFWSHPVENEQPEVDLTAHDMAIRDAWRVVKPDDIVWVLGDICVSGKTWRIALEVLRRFPGRKRLVCGNHDLVSSVHREAWKYQREALEIFETVQDFAKVKIGSRTVLLSHYPYSGIGSEGVDDETGRPRSTERYTEFRLTDCGTPLIHGHTHGKERLHFSAAGTPEIHVGLDAWNMKLVSQREIELLLDTPISSDTVEEPTALLSR